MKVSELGEVGLVKLLAEMVNKSRDSRAVSWQQLLVGIGDDTAAWRCDDSIQLAKVDALLERVHFSLDWTSWEDLGWKAVAINLSDIAAMGGQPRYALVSLALPSDAEVDSVVSLYRGILEITSKFGVAVVGGDTDSAPWVSITVTLLGSASPDKPLLLRSAAKPGNLIAVTGYLGGARGGLEMLTRKLIFNATDDSYLKKAFLRPYPRIAEGQQLVDAGVRCAIDISDGLVRDMEHICHASGVGARIEIERVPVAPAVKTNFGNQALEMALTGGEDYELLFAADARTIDKVKKILSCPVTVIGEITAGHTGEVSLIDPQGKPLILKKSGWEHFISR